jgi:hypothetical protein
MIRAEDFLTMANGNPQRAMDMLLADLCGLLPRHGTTALGLQGIKIATALAFRLGELQAIQQMVDSMIRIENPQDQRQRRTIVEIAHSIDTFLNGKAKGDLRANAFVILLFERGQDESNYLSNTDRPNAIRVMEAQVEKLKASFPQLVEQAKEETTAETKDEPEGTA